MGLKVPFLQVIPINTIYKYVTTSTTSHRLPLEKAS